MFPVDTRPRIVLTSRRLELLQLVADGHTLDSAARRLGVSVWTAKLDMRVIRIHLHAKTSTHAVALAWRAGLIR